VAVRAAAVAVVTDGLLATALMVRLARRDAEFVRPA
jgi:hypothetical protein